MTTFSSCPRSKFKKKGEISPPYSIVTLCLYHMIGYFIYVKGCVNYRSYGGCGICVLCIMCKLVDLVFLSHNLKSLICWLQNQDEQIIKKKTTREIEALQNFHHSSIFSFWSDMRCLTARGSENKRWVVVFMVWRLNLEFKFGLFMDTDW